MLKKNYWDWKKFLTVEEYAIEIPNRSKL